MKLTTEQVANLLSVKVCSVNKLKQQGLLYPRMEEVGYKIVYEYKLGRNIYYETKDVPVSMQEFYKNTFGTDFKDFYKYYLRRTSLARGTKVSIENVLSKQVLAEELGVTRKTISRWDNKLQELGIISESGYIYVRVISKPDKKRYITSVEDYDNFCKNKKAVKELDDILESAYRKGNMSFHTLKCAYKDNNSWKEELTESYVYRVKTFLLNSDNSIHVAIKPIMEKESVLNGK